MKLAVTAEARIHEPIAGATEKLWDSEQLLLASTDYKVTRPKPKVDAVTVQWGLPYAHAGCQISSTFKSWAARTSGNT